MKRLAILILRSGDETGFEDSLASVLANQPPGSQVIVVSPGGYEDPYDLGGEVTFVDIPADAKGANWIRAGLSAADADCEVVHLLSNNLLIEEGWTEPVTSRFDESHIGAVVPLVIGCDGRIAAAGIHASFTGQPLPTARGRKPSSKRQLKPSAPSWIAAFIRRDLLAESMDPVFEDWLSELDVASCLRDRAYTIEVCPACRLRGDLDLASNCSPFRESQLKERLFWKHRSSTLLLPAHLLAILGEAVGSLLRGQSISRVAGRAVGLAQAPFDALRRRSRRRAEGRCPLPEAADCNPSATAAATIERRPAA